MEPSFNIPPPVSNSPRGILKKPALWNELNVISSFMLEHTTARLFNKPCCMSGFHTITSAIFLCRPLLTHPIHTHENKQSHFQQSLRALVITGQYTTEIFFKYIFYTNNKKYPRIVCVKLSKKPRGYVEPRGVI